jgi:hypothetical protein
VLSLSAPALVSLPALMPVSDDRVTLDADPVDVTVGALTSADAKDVLDTKVGKGEGNWKK